MEKKWFGFDRVLSQSGDAFCGWLASCRGSIARFCASIWMSWSQVWYPSLGMPFSFRGLISYAARLQP